VKRRRHSSTCAFQGRFLPAPRDVGDRGFTASWRVGNLALNRPTLSIDAGDKIPSRWSIRSISDRR
jgi:inner membrane protein